MSDHRQAAIDALHEAKQVVEDRDSPYYKDPEVLAQIALAHVAIAQLDQNHRATDFSELANRVSILESQPVAHDVLGTEEDSGTSTDTASTNRLDEWVESAKPYITDSNYSALVDAVQLVHAGYYSGFRTWLERNSINLPTGHLNEATLAFNEVYNYHMSADKR